MSGTKSKRDDDGSSSNVSHNKRFKVGDIVEVGKDRGPGFNEYGTARVTAVNGSEYGVKFIVSSVKDVVDEDHLSHAADISESHLASRSSSRATLRRNVSVTSTTSSSTGESLKVSSTIRISRKKKSELEGRINTDSDSDSKLSSKCWTIFRSCAQIFGILVVLFFFWIDSFRGYIPPPHMQGHSVVFQENFIPQNIAKQIREMLYSVGETDGFPTNLRGGVDFYATKHEHVGEAVPLNVDGKCDHHMLAPNKDGTSCVLPGRIDVGIQFLKTGGVEGLKENYRTLSSRLQSFAMYVFELEKAPAVKTLFESDDFVKLAQKVCPSHKQVLDPFQVNFVIQVPGQSVATHIDGSAMYWGASRFDFPQWLLAAMKLSALPQFEEYFVDQVQVVGYLHEWEPSSTTKGDFVYFDGSSRLGSTQPPLPLAASGVDGTKTVHAAMIYRPDELPPDISKDDDALLLFKPKHATSENKNKSSSSTSTPTKLPIGNWEVEINGTTIQSYSFNDFRISVVYRALCFSDDQERIAHHKQVGLDHSTHSLALENVLRIFVEDMESKQLLKKVVSSEKRSSNSINTSSEQRIKNALVNTPEARLELAEKIMKHYVKYPNPIPPATLPWNYCALPVLMPWTETILSLFCK